MDEYDEKLLQNLRKLLRNLVLAFITRTVFITEVLYDGIKKQVRQCEVPTTSLFRSFQGRLATVYYLLSIFLSLTFIDSFLYLQLLPISITHRIFSN